MFGPIAALNIRDYAIPTVYELFSDFYFGFQSIS